jgi:hypothetical protein
MYLNHVAIPIKATRLLIELIPCYDIYIFYEIRFLFQHIFNDSPLMAAWGQIAEGTHSLYRPLVMCEYYF